MPPLADTINDHLEGAATVVLQAYEGGRESAVPVETHPLARRIETRDSRTCALCRWLHGKVFRRGSAEYERYRPPVHINCRGVNSYIGKQQVGPDGKPTQPTFGRPPEDLVDRHGHFVTEPKKYAPLRVPARPTGRDVIAYRKGGTGPAILRWRDNLTQEALRETLQTMAEGLRNVRRLQGEHDVALAMQMMSHASHRGLFDHPKRDFVKHAGDWEHTVGELTDAEFRNVPGWVVDSEDVRLASRVDAKYGTEWVLYVPRLPLPDGSDLDQVALFYAPDRGTVIQWWRVDDPEKLVADSSFRAITGDWSTLYAD